jgi:hypothetical protein
MNDVECVTINIRQLRHAEGTPRLFEAVNTSVLHLRLTDEKRLENGSVILTYVPR